VLRGRDADAGPAGRRRHRGLSEDVREEGHAAVLPDLGVAGFGGGHRVREEGRRGAGGEGPERNHREDGQGREE